MALSSPLLWLGLAGVLLLLVLVGADLDGMMLVGGLAALLLATATALLPLPPLLQLTLFALLAGLGYALLRRSSARRGETPIRPAAGADLAEVIDPFNPSGEGRVRWQGQSWAAQNLEPGHRLAAGSRVTVLGREGTRLQVVPSAEGTATSRGGEQGDQG
ncbi:MAG: NfeD family protein [Synechococcaceae cyanobacterium]|nr:NfeD family protein [Synechococcaceae cyanobacterium]